MERDYKHLILKMLNHYGCKSTDVSLVYSNDVWARTATVPSPGSKKLSINARVKNRYYMKTTSTSKIDNVQELTLNQKFNITVGSKLVLNNDAGSLLIVLRSSCRQHQQ